LTADGADFSDEAKRGASMTAKETWSLTTDYPSPQERDRDFGYPSPPRFSSPFETFVVAETWSQISGWEFLQKTKIEMQWA